VSAAQRSRAIETRSHSSGQIAAGVSPKYSSVSAMLATERASMALTELYFGLTPAAIWPLLCERVSMARLRWAALTGQNLDADHAAALGLVDEVVAGEDALKPCLRALRRTSTQAATVLKRATAPIGAVSLGAERTRVRLQHPEVKERIARFLDGGTPWS
jgi:enoyl-CoA hydratase/carnithine racemase